MPIDVVGVFGFLTREPFKEDMPMCHKSESLVNSQRTFFSWEIQFSLKYYAKLTTRFLFLLVIIRLKAMIGKNHSTETNNVDQQNTIVHQVST